MHSPNNIYLDGAILYVVRDTTTEDTIEENSTMVNTIKSTFPRKQLEVLRYLAENGPKNSYEISRGLDTSYSVVHKWMRRSQQQGFISPTQEKKGKKGVMTKPYRLTLAGLASAFENEELWSNVDQIAGNWGELAPLVFGKWSYFKERELGKEAMERLRQMFHGEGVLKLKNVGERPQIAKDYPYRLYDPLLLSHLLHPSEDSSMHPMLFAEFFFLPLLDSPFGFSLERWFKAIQDDSDLKQWAKLFFRGQATAYRSKSERYEQLLRELEAGGD